jgi:hypothetical protein
VCLVRGHIIYISSSVKFGDEGHAYNNGCLELPRVSKAHDVVLETVSFTK